MSENFAQLFEESLKTVEMDVGSIITGVVIAIDGESVTVHAGLKSEGVIPRIQFLDDNGEFHLDIGDEVQVALEAVRTAARDGSNLVEPCLAVSYTHLRAHETPEQLVCRLLLEKKTRTTSI